MKIRILLAALGIFALLSGALKSRAHVSERMGGVGLGVLEAVLGFVLVMSQIPGMAAEGARITLGWATLLLMGVSNIHAMFRAGGVARRRQDSEGHRLYTQIKFQEALAKADSSGVAEVEVEADSEEPPGPLVRMNDYQPDRRLKHSPKRRGRTHRRDHGGRRETHGRPSIDRERNGPHDGGKHGPGQGLTGQPRQQQRDAGRGRTQLVDDRGSRYGQRATLGPPPNRGQRSPGRDHVQPAIEVRNVAWKHERQRTPIGRQHEPQQPDEIQTVQVVEKPRAGRNHLAGSYQTAP